MGWVDTPEHVALLGVVLAHDGLEVCQDAASLVEVIFEVGRDGFTRPNGQCLWPIGFVAPLEKRVRVVENAVVSIPDWDPHVIHAKLESGVALDCDSRNRRSSGNVKASFVLIRSDS